MKNIAKKSKGIDNKKRNQFLQFLFINSNSFYSIPFQFQFLELELELVSIPIPIPEIGPWPGRFRTVTLVWIGWWLWNDAQSLKQYKIGALLFFNVICQISRSHGTKKSLILTRIECYRTVTPVSIHWWLWNDAQSLIRYRRGALLFFEVIHQIPRSPGWKMDDLNPIWVRLLGLSQLSNPSDLPCFTTVCRSLSKYMSNFDGFSVFLSFKHFEITVVTNSSDLKNYHIKKTRPAWFYCMRTKHTSCDLTREITS